jgi:putative two-component system response regulator
VKILVVDDDVINTELVAEALQSQGYEVQRAFNGAEALQLIRTGDFRMVISDWQMPGMDGRELCRSVRQRVHGPYIYFILLTSFDDVEHVVHGLQSGADDFITKPFHPMELLVRVRTGERILGLESREMMIFALAKLAESRDMETGQHLERMREYARILAADLSNHPDFSDVIDGEYVKQIYLTAPLHDIGKVAIPDHILRKPGKLTDEEFEIMKTHTLHGAQTLEDVARNHPGAAFLKMARDIAISHHERMDGKGYPYGLVGAEIPLCGRITAVADVYDALTSARVYKKAYTHEEALRIMLAEGNRQFDQRVLQAMLQHTQEFVEIRERYAEGAQALPHLITAVTATT